MATIGAAGLVSSLGCDLVTACAAQRAGMVRVSPISDDLGVDGDSEGEPLLGSPIRGLTDGFAHTGSWTRMALAALQDLRSHTRSQLTDDPAFWQSTPVIWSLPLVTAERFGWTEGEAGDALRSSTLQCLADLSQLPLRSGPDSQLFCAGHCGGALALQAARRLLAAGSPAVLLIATDSWIDALSVQSLQATGRLKTAEQPVGLRPGEGGVCLLLEAGPGARAGAGPLARIEAVTASAPLLAADEATAEALTEQAPRIGRALADAVRACLAEAASPLPFHGDLILDLNGETWRALAWGHAQALLGGTIDWHSTAVTLPAISFGDVGAASAALATCIALRSYARGYASSGQTLVCSLSDNGQAAAVALRQPARSQ